MRPVHVDKQKGAGNRAFLLLNTPAHPHLLASENDASCLKVKENRSLASFGQRPPGGIPGITPFLRGNVILHRLVEVFHQGGVNKLAVGSGQWAVIRD